MSKKIFFVDLDGTLLTDEKKVSPRTIEAVQDFTDRGNYFVICTGRPTISAINFFHTLGLSDKGSFIISFNGAHIYDCENKKTLSRTPLSYEQTKQIFEICERTGLYCQTFNETHVVCKKLGKSSDFYYTQNPIPFLETDDILSALDMPPTKVMSIELDDYSKLEILRNEITKEMDVSSMEVSNSSDFYLEFMSADAGKGNAVKELCNYLNIPIEDSIAAGDHQNDMTMLKVAGLSIGMLNGIDEVKKTVDVITETDNNHDGLVPFFDACK